MDWMKRSRAGSVMVSFCCMLILAAQAPVFADQVWNGTSKTDAASRTGVVSIGTTIAPGTNSKLQINGGAAVGYSTSTTVPANGLNVAGNVGIGATLPATAPVSGVLSVKNIIANGVFPVTAYGADTINPCGAAFNAALSAAQSAGGGIVLVPPGKYKFSSSQTLTIPSGVTLSGNWTSPHGTETNTHTAHNLGAILWATSTSGPFITMSHTSCIQGLSIYYPQQTVPPTTYPFTINASNYASIMDVTLINSYQGINIYGMSHYLKNVNMCALKKGIVIDNSTDASRLENVNIHPKFWYPYLSIPNCNALTNYLDSNLTGYTFYRTDGNYALNCFIFHAYCGIDLEESPDGDPWVQWIQGGTDACKFAVICNAVQQYTGCLFSNALFTGMHYLTRGGINYSNCDMVGNLLAPNYSDYVIYYNNGEPTLPISPISLNSCKFYWWNINNNKSYAIKVMGSNSQVIVSGCQFYHNNSYIGVYHFYVGTGATATVMGCTFSTGPNYWTEQNGTLQHLLNIPIGW